MASDSKMYPTLHNDETQGEVLLCDSGFTFIDFLPRVIKAGGLFKSRTYESFRVLVDRANEFLRKNRRWKIVTCERVEFATSFNNEINPIKMTYVEYGESYTSYIIGLRLWLTERKDEKEREQQIGYFNLIPQQVEKGGIFKQPTFETLDTVIQRFNSMLQYNPLPGRIIGIESQVMKLPNFNSFDPDHSNWSESGKDIKYFITIIRIFYEIMDCVSEEIGMTDFIPATLSEGILLVKRPQYEPFSTTMNRASAWLSQQKDLRFCNAQTLEVPLEWDYAVNTRSMNYSEYGSTDYIKVLRIAYTKPIQDKTSPIAELTCRSFTPLQLTTGIFVPEYEDLLVTRERISAWVKAAGARVISAETTAYRITTKGERTQVAEGSFTYRVGKKGDYWMFIIRLYIDGAYKEPPPEVLPAMPEIQHSSCHIS